MIYAAAAFAAAAAAAAAGLLGLALCPSLARRHQHAKMPPQQREDGEVRGRPREQGPPSRQAHGRLAAVHYAKHLAAVGAGGSWVPLRPPTAALAPYPHVCPIHI